MPSPAAPTRLSTRRSLPSFLLVSRVAPQGGPGHGCPPGGPLPGQWARGGEGGVQAWSQTPEAVGVNITRQPSVSFALCSRRGRCRGPGASWIYQVGVRQDCTRREQGRVGTVRGLGSTPGPRAKRADRDVMGQPFTWRPAPTAPGLTSVPAAEGLVSASQGLGLRAAPLPPGPPAWGSALTHPPQVLLGWAGSSEERRAEGGGPGSIPTERA